jgi:hypothetical protein
MEMEVFQFQRGHRSLESTKASFVHPIVALIGRIEDEVKVTG